MKLLLPILAICLMASCTPLQPVQMQGVYVHLVRAESAKRWIDGRWYGDSLFTYMSNLGTEYNIERNLGKVAVMYIPK